MSELYKFPDLKTAQREASDWIVRLNREHVSQEDRVDFELWLSSSAANAKAYHALTNTWNRFAAAGGTVRAVAFGTRMHKATRKPRRNWLVAASAAACLLLTVGNFMWSGPTQSPSSYETGVGEQASITLPDGSQMKLNSDSKVSIDYSDRARLIRLTKGEALFFVEPMTERPFWVLAGRTWVRAVGTAFNVHNRENGVRVTVTEGVVKVGTLAKRPLATDLLENTDEGARLERGQQIEVQGSETSFVALAPARLEQELSWSQGLVHFQDQTLREVVRQMSPYSPLEINVSDEAGASKISGTFHPSQQGVEAMLTMLEQGLLLDVERESKRKVHIEVAKSNDRPKQ